MTKERKDNITVCSAVAMLIFGCVLTTIAFFLEPMGVIHDSVLWVLGQCFIYAGGALGIAMRGGMSTSDTMATDTALLELMRMVRT